MRHQDTRKKTRAGRRIRLALMETVLTGDVGGTNARFVLFRDGVMQADSYRVIPVVEYTDLGDAVAEYIRLVDGTDIEKASFSFASTAKYSDNMELTNSCMTVSVSGLLQRFGWRRARIVNDFTAAAVGILSLPHEQLEKVCGGESDPVGPRAVLGPGTGLGVSGLLYTGSYWLPLQSQGGHVSMAAQNERELKIYQQLLKAHSHVSAERYLSGPGTVNLYRAICAVDKLPVKFDRAAEITTSAIDGSCNVCVEAMELFCKWLGIVAGNLAVTLGSTGGIYIAGGIVPQLGEFFNGSGFVQALQQKGRFSEFVSAMPVWLVTGGEPALYGSFTCLDNNYDGFGFTVDLC